jgi:MinD-like ATPase involved in chromosome partitioning or flagellar assembly
MLDASPCGADRLFFRGWHRFCLVLAAIAAVPLRLPNRGISRQCAILRLIWNSSMITVPDSVAKGPTMNVVPGAEPPARPRFLGVDPARVLHTLRQRTKLLGGAAALCGLIALLAGLIFGAPAYRAQATLVFNPLPIPEHQRGLIPVQKFDTLAGLITSPSNLQTLADEFGLTIEPSVMKNFFKIEEPPAGAEKITIALEWPESQRGADLVNRLTAIFIERIAAARIHQIDGYYRDTEKSLRDCKQRVRAARDDYHKILDEAKIADLKVELERVSKELSDIDVESAMRRREIDNIHAQMQREKEYIEELNDKVKKKDPIQGAVNEEYRRRLQDLQLALTQEEGKLARATVLLKKARDERKRLERYVRDKIATQTELDSLIKEINQLEPEVTTGEKVVRQLRAEHEQQQQNPASPLIQQALLRLRELELKLSGAQGEITGVGVRLAAKRQEATRLSAVKRQADEPARRLERAEAEQKQLEEQLATLRSLKGSDIKEFLLESPAVPSLSPVSSSTRKIVIGTFAVPMLLLVLGIVGMAMCSPRWQAESLAERMRLPVLARADAASPVAGPAKLLSPEESRSLALRLRQYVPQPGAAILFSSLRDGDDLDGLIGDLSQSLAMRDERVLIIDARLDRGRLASLVKMVERPVETVTASSIQAGDMVESGRGLALEVAENGEVMLDDADPCYAGLGQYLIFAEQNPTAFIHPTTTRGVSLLAAGGDSPGLDALASEPMKNLLAQVRNDYSIVLLVGPAVTQGTDTEILAAYADGIVVVINGSCGNDAAARCFQALKDVNAPLLGAVVCV